MASIDTSGNLSLDGGTGSIGSFLSTVQKIAPVVQAGVNAAAKISGNPSLGDLGKAVHATGATAKALQHVGIAGPDADLMNKIIASVGTTSADQSSKISESIGASIAQMQAQERAIAGTISSAIVTAIALAVMAEMTTLSASGPYGAAIGAVAAAFTAAATMLTGGPSLQITNGNTFSAKDYAGNNMQNAGNWLGDPKNATKLVGLTVKCFGDTFNLFYANPIWLFVNQKQTGLPQPLPPDFETGAPLDVVYENAPGALEFLNQVQFALATALVHGSPGLLPLFMQVQKNPSREKIDQDLSHYNPIPVTITAVNTGPFKGKAQSTVSKPVPKWAPGTLFASKDNIITVEGLTFSANQGVVYAGAPNFLTNDSVITPSGKGIVDAGSKIVSQTDPADGIHLLQSMLPSVTSDQCSRIFTAAKPAYDALIAKVDAWLDTQKVAPAPGAFAQFNLTPTDVTAAIALWHTRHPANPPLVHPSVTVATHLATKLHPPSAVRPVTIPKPAPKPAPLPPRRVTIARSKPNPIAKAWRAVPLPGKLAIGGTGLAAAIFGLVKLRTPKLPPPGTPGGF
jgi:hypothetical protein